MENMYTEQLKLLMEFIELQSEAMGKDHKYPEAIRHRSILLRERATKQIQELINLEG